MNTRRFQSWESAGAGRHGHPYGLALVLPMALVISATTAAAEAVPAPAPAQAATDSEGQPQSRWLPWLGCWDLILETVDYWEESEKRDVLVCLKPGPDRETVAITTLAGGAVVLEEMLEADGRQHPVEESGCRGWRSAEWSGDGRRLFMRSETTCDKDVRREVSGVSFMASRSRWLDIQSIRSGDTRELIIRKYRVADPEMVNEAGLESFIMDEAMASAARREAARALMVEDVVEAVRKSEPAVVEAALLETDSRFDVDAATLLRLADAKVSGEVIDLMVALSYPDYFNIRRQGMVRIAEQPGAESYQPVSGGGYGLYDFWYPFYFAPFGYYSYWSWYAPYGSYYVLRPSGPVADGGGRVVRGQGYTRVWPREDTARPRGSGGGSWLGGGHSGSSQGSASSGGYSSGGAASSRTAHPKHNPE